MHEVNQTGVLKRVSANKLMATSTLFERPDPYKIQPLLSLHPLCVLLLSIVIIYHTENKHIKWGKI